MTTRAVLIQAVYRSQLMTLALANKLDPELVIAADPHRPTAPRQRWLTMIALRRRSIYLTVVALDLAQAEVGAAIGLSRQAVQLIMRQVEEERDGRAIDQQLDRMTFLTGGMAA